MLPPLAVAAGASESPLDQRSGKLVLGFEEVQGTDGLNLPLALGGRRRRRRRRWLNGRGRIRMSAHPPPIRRRQGVFQKKFEP